MNRRKLLRLGGGLTLGSVLAACAGPGGGKEREGEGESVLVIGAGIAGLAAARSLQAAGYTVLVLEGRDRIGGRVFTSHLWPEAPVDLGASWIHGVRHNPLSALADELSLERRRTDYDRAILYDADGSEIEDGQLAEIERIADRLLSEAMARADSVDEPGLSLGEAIAWAMDRQGLNGSDRRYLGYYFNSVIEHEFAADIEALSARDWDEGEALGGGDVLFPAGYGSIIEYLAQGLDILLGHPVTRVDYSRSEVLVTSRKGLFQADRVLVTLPLGVLQAAMVTFTPDLPAEKRTGIAALGMGLLDKTVLRFDQEFWPRDVEFIQYVGAEKGRWAEWLNLQAHTGEPVLMGFNAGSYAQALERRSDTDIVADAMGVLRSIYGSQIPEPREQQISRWASDPFALGSYSFLKAGADSDSRRALAAPVTDRLYFAGEATHVDYPSTVHGAYLSGLRAASEIINA